MTAFLIGVRHAFDLDHIATIDATVRELNASGKPSAAVGFRFAAGHSTVVILAVGLLAAGVDLVRQQLTAEESTVLQGLGLWGLGFSTFTLLVLGIGNLIRAAQLGFQPSAAGTAGARFPIGLFSRILGPVLRRISSARRMYFVGQGCA